MSIYDSLNLRQQQAVYHTKGPLLVLAGAGSGKTRVLTHRIAYLIEHEGINPWNIIAITFTNKAAKEMRERVDKLVAFGAESIWVSTFHSSCVRILRRHIDYLGYSTNFTIYDTDDQRTLMKQVLKQLDVDPKQYRERVVMGYISSAKDELISPDQFESEAADYRMCKVAEIYREYQNQLKKNNALDFDDLINKTVQLFQDFPEILNYYQQRFQYIMVDEYQDTNTAQFELVRLLAAQFKNICVVGDDDQSIYKFRGANVENILNFEDSFPGAEVIKLEQNYRSTQHILDAANAVIRHNAGRKDKTLWTANPEGQKVSFRQFDQAYDEADFIIRDIRDGSFAYEDCAVLYRTNAQSRLLEEMCVTYNIPYRLVGGVNFYQRKEIKDILAYLKVIANGVDDLAVLRIVNVPKRGIGAATIGKVTAYALAEGISLYEGLCRAKEVPGIGKAAIRIQTFIDQIEFMKTGLATEGLGIWDLIEDILENTGYRRELEAEGEIESETRMENIEELMNKAASYTAESEAPNLDEFLEEVALVADIDRVDDSESRLTLMTLHSAKGLEFPKVYLGGMEDGLFPSMMAVSSDDPSDVEEERRLCYVGITRAMKELVMTCARIRLVNGESRYSRISRFMDEIPAALLDQGRPEPHPKSVFSSRARAEKKAENKLSGVSSFGTKSNAYASAKPFPPLAFGKQFAVTKADGLDYQIQDRVKHIKFGIGTVLDIKDGARDFEVTVEFEQSGIKKMFASFAKLQKV